jgi:hypothetical protein
VEDSGNGRRRREITMTIESQELYRQTADAYLQGKPAPNIPKPKDVPEGLTPLELGRLGYKQSARSEQTRKTPAKPALSKVMGELHYDFVDLLKSPPTKQEARFLSRDMQTLLQDLEYADKGIQTIPRLEQTIRGIESQMYQAMIDKQPDKYNDLELSLRNEQKTLDDIQVKVKDSIRAAEAFHSNNPEEIRKSLDTLKTLRTELSAPYRYSDAKDGMATHTKPVIQWLGDLKDKGSLDDRMLAKQVLDAGGVDAKSLLTEVERQGMSLTERAVAEMRDVEAGKSSPESQNIGHKSHGDT